MWNPIKAIRDEVEDFEEDVNEAWEDVKNAGDDIADAVKNPRGTIEDGLNSLGDVTGIAVIREDISDGLTDIGETILSAPGVAYEVYLDEIENPIGDFSRTFQWSDTFNSVTDPLAQFEDYVLDAFDGLADSVNDGLNNLGEWLDRTGQQFGDYFDERMDELGEGIARLWERVVEVLNETFDKLFPMLRYLLIAIIAYVAFKTLSDASSMLTSKDHADTQIEAENIESVDEKDVKQSE